MSYNGRSRLGGSLARGLIPKHHVGNDISHERESISKPHLHFYRAEGCEWRVRYILYICTCVSRQMMVYIYAIRLTITVAGWYKNGAEEVAMHSSDSNPHHWNAARKLVFSVPGAGPLGFFFSGISTLPAGLAWTQFQPRVEIRNTDWGVQSV